MGTNLLVTGGAGYIGTHTLVELINSGYSVVVLDDFSNSSARAIARVEDITKKKIELIHGSVCDKKKLDDIFERSDRQKIDCVLHFSGFKAVAESVKYPVRYCENNIAGTLTLLASMQEHGVNKIVFSSSATVYGLPEFLPYTENHPIAPMNPYGWTKAAVENILKYHCAACPEFSAISLRYFNPIGAHESGLIGEDPRGIPNNLFPFILQVAVGRRDSLSVFGADYPTVDGTGVRDYIHVVDLALGHVRAIECVGNELRNFVPINLGTGRGVSVLELISMFEQTTGETIPYHIAERRGGDIAEMWAEVSRAKQLLGWQASRTLEDMCRDGWQWQVKNPGGYDCQGFDG